MFVVCVCLRWIDGSCCLTRGASSSPVMFAWARSGITPSSWCFVSAGVVLVWVVDETASLHRWHRCLVSDAVYLQCEWKNSPASSAFYETFYTNICFLRESKRQRPLKPHPSRHQKDDRVKHISIFFSLLYGTWRCNATTLASTNSSWQHTNLECRYNTNTYITLSLLPIKSCKPLKMCPFLTYTL